MHIKLIFFTLINCQEFKLYFPDQIIQSANNIFKSNGKHDNTSAKLLQPKIHLPSLPLTQTAKYHKESMLIPA